MTANRNKVLGIVGVILIVVYSVTMMATGGSANWAWLLLIAGLALVASPATSAITSRSRNDG